MQKWFEGIDNVDHLSHKNMRIVHWRPQLHCWGGFSGLLLSVAWMWPGENAINIWITVFEMVLPLFQVIKHIVDEEPAAGEKQSSDQWVDLLKIKIRPPEKKHYFPTSTSTNKPIWSLFSYNVLTQPNLSSAYLSACVRLLILPGWGQTIKLVFQSP